MKSKKGQTNIAILAVMTTIIIAGILTIPQLNIGNNNTIFNQKSELEKFNSIDEIKEYLEQEQQNGMYSSNQQGSIRATSSVTESADMISSTGKSAPSTTQESTTDFSTTNIQVKGVDEADIVKNDGKYIYVLSGKTISIINAYPPQNAEIISTINITGNPQELYIDGDRLIILGNDYIYEDAAQPLIENELVNTGNSEKMMIENTGTIMIYPQRQSRQIAFAHIYDIQDRENPKQTRNVTVDGHYFDSRMIDNEVYIIATQYTYYSDNIALPEIRYSNKKITPEIYHFTNMPDNSHTFTTIMSINTQDDEKDVESKVYLLGSTQNIYVSQENIYITYQRRVSNTHYQDIMFDEVIIPLVPNHIAKELKQIQDSNDSYWEKQNKMSNVLESYSNTLTPEKIRELETEAETNMAELALRIAKETDKTVIHKIGIEDGNINYKDSGEVSGSPLNQFSMDEHNGYFRIATTVRVNNGGMGISTQTRTVSSMQTQILEVDPVQTQGTSAVESSSTSSVTTKESTMTISPKSTPSPTMAPPRPTIPSTINNLYILDEKMNIVGQVEDLAPDESIYSARFMGDKAYLVTFKKVDPLFVIDLSDPKNPTVTGKLKIPGYSDYLHPYDENHLIGIGKEAVASDNGNSGLYQGVKVALFDVTDIENPIEISNIEIGDRGTDSDALHNHKAFLFDKEKNLLVLPILLAEIDKSKYEDEIPTWAYGEYKWQGAYVFNIDLENGIQIKERITHSEIDQNDNNNNRWYYYGSKYSIKRSLYMDDYLYTISEGMVKINELDNLDEINKISLPQNNNNYPTKIY